MQAFKKIRASAIILPIKDIDTDMIIPAQYLTGISREGYGKNLFRRLCDEQKDFPLNSEKYRNAKILIAKSNFGCGSSREHAVWALMGWGIRVVIASSFADIFAANSAKNGLVLIELREKLINKILEEFNFEGNEFTIDLEQQTIGLPSGETSGFKFDPFLKMCILHGYDELDYILAHKEKIADYKVIRKKNLFYSTLYPNR